MSEVGKMGKRRSKSSGPAPPAKEDDGPRVQFAFPHVPRGRPAPVSAVTCGGGAAPSMADVLSGRATKPAAHSASTTKSAHDAGRPVGKAVDSDNDDIDFEMAEEPQGARKRRLDEVPSPPPPSKPRTDAPNGDVAASAAPNSGVAKSRIPPLVVESLPNYPAHMAAIKKAWGRFPSARAYGKGIRFTPNSEEEYRVVQRYLTQLEKTENISWFSYSLPAERSMKVAIRGVPFGTDTQLIGDALAELGHTAEYVRHIKGQQGRPGCIYMAVLKRSSNTAKVFEIKELFGLGGIIIEAWRGKKRPAQCHRCQGFRHTSAHCHRPIKCVRCGEGHAASSCPVARDSPAKCANCGGDHPANFVKCPVVKTEAKNKKAGTVAISARSRSKIARSIAASNVEAEAASATLMAEANKPKPRKVATPTPAPKPKKAKKPKGKKTQAQTPAKVTESSTAQLSTPEVIDTRAPRSNNARAPKREGARQPSRSRSALRTPNSVPKEMTISALLPEILGIVAEVMEATSRGQTPLQALMGSLPKIISAITNVCAALR